MALGGACHRLPEEAIPEGATSEGLTFSQLFATNETFEDGGVMEGMGKLRLQLDAAEGELSGYVASPSGDVTIDGQTVPDDQGALITGAGWWEPDSEERCFAAVFTTVGESGLAARVDGCALQLWIEVQIGDEDAVEESFNMSVYPPFDPFFYE